MILSKLRISTILVLVGTIAYLVLPTQANSEGIDATRILRTEKVKKSTGEIISDIPGEILKLPFYTLEILTNTIATR